MFSSRRSTQKSCAWGGIQSAFPSLEVRACQRWVCVSITYVCPKGRIICGAHDCVDLALSGCVGFHLLDGCPQAGHVVSHVGRSGCVLDTLFLDDHLLLYTTRATTSNSLRHTYMNLRYVRHVQGYLRGPHSRQGARVEGTPPHCHSQVRHTWCILIKAWQCFSKQRL